MVKIFVGKLSDEVTSEDLRSLFEQAGTVDSADRVHGKDIGFVHMPNEKEAFLAVRNMNRASFKGSCLNVQLSQVKVQKLFLGNLPKEASCAEIQQLFESYGAKVVNAENTDKGFGFVRLENDKGFSVMNSLIRSVMTHPFKGRHLQIELSEDLSKEQKALKRAEQEAAQAAEWEATPPELRAAPGFSGGYPMPEPDAGFVRGRGRGGLRGRGGFRGRGAAPPYSQVGHWSQDPHANKMGRGGRGAPGGLLAAARGRGGPGLGRPYPYPRPGPDPYQGLGTELALEFGGGYGEEEDNNENSETEDGKKVLNDYYSLMFESYANSQTQLFETGQFSDYTIQCEGTEFKVHRVVLAPKSPVLMSVMSGTPSPMLIRDVDSSTLQILLLFMYSGRVEVEGINPAKIMKLLTAADLYQVANVREGLEATLMENISEDTAVDYLIFSEELQLSQLRLEVGKYICSHSKQFKSRPDFKKLSQYPHLVMELFDHASFF